MSTSSASSRGACLLRLERSAIRSHLNLVRRFARLNRCLSPNRVIPIATLPGELRLVPHCKELDEWVGMKRTSSAAARNIKQNPTWNGPPNRSCRFVVSSKRMMTFCDSEMLVGLSPFPVTVANEGLVRDSLLNMEYSWWWLLLVRGITQDVSYIWQGFATHSRFIKFLGALVEKHQSYLGMTVLPCLVSKGHLFF